MKKAKVVVCKHCGATFRNRRFWVLPKNDPSPKKRCVRCGARGPFEQATKEDIEAFSNKLTHNLNLFGILEILAGLLIIAAIVYGILNEQSSKVNQL